MKPPETSFHTSRWFETTLFLLAILIVCSAFGKLQADPQKNRSTDELRKQLRKKVRKLQNKRASFQQSLRKNERNIRSKKEKLATLETQLKKLNETRNGLQKNLDRHRKQNRNLNEQLDRLREDRTRILNHLESFGRKLRSHVRSTIPYRKQKRTERITTLLKKLRNHRNTFDPTPIISVLTGFRAFVLDEYSDSIRSSIETRRVQLPDGRKKYANVGRIGQGIQFFVTEDRKEGGVRIWKEQEWKWLTSPENISYSLLHRGLNIIRERERPRRIPFPAPYRFPPFTTEPTGTNQQNR